MSNEADQEKLLARWLSGELSEADRQLLEKESGLDDLRFALNDLEGWKVPDLDVDSGLNDLKTRLDRVIVPKQNKQVFFQPWLRIAASIVLIATVFYVFNSLLTSGPTTVSTGFGETLSHVLPDGSRVDLDAQSSITYSEKNWDKQRNLSMEGRALFSVQKGQSFNVDTEEGSVTVLGTIFEVDQRAVGALDVSCFEGLVRVNIINKEELLEAGQGLQAVNGQITRLAIGTQIPSWVDKKSQYNETALSEVVKDLADFYGTEIILPDHVLSSPFTGELNYSSLTDALDVLAQIFELTYSREGAKVVFE